MAEDQDFVSISDSSVPNAGRIYDYLLGGNHNFEVDRVAAEQLKKQTPEIAEDVRLVRWFLGAAVRELSKQGFTSFLDFASGLPTVDHIHNTAPGGTQVLYSDIDPVTVSYGQEIVRDLPDIGYRLADAGTPEQLLGSEQAERLIGAGKRTAVGFSGIAWFLPDEKVAHALEKIYQWVGPGSRLFISDVSNERATEAGHDISEFYAKVNQPLYLRSESRIRELFGRWKISDPGIRPLESWIGIDSSFTQGGDLSGGGRLIGAILVKE